MAIIQEMTDHSQKATRNIVIGGAIFVGIMFILSLTPLPKQAPGLFFVAIALFFVAVFILSLRYGGSGGDAGGFDGGDCGGGDGGD